MDDDQNRILEQRKKETFAFYLTKHFCQKEYDTWWERAHCYIICTSHTSTLQLDKLFLY